MKTNSHLLNASSSLWRSDIQSMRGVAVLLVILHHLSLPGFEYGYLGVDIFFVISGYVITGYILSQIEKGTWTLSEFYRRRAWRLLPTLFGVLTLVLIGAYISPLSYRAEIFQSIPFSVLGISNIYFFSQAGYFDNESILKPLLHTWSLGVEEQFYIIFAPLIALFGKPAFKYFTLAVCVIFAVVIYFSLNNPDAWFYLLPFRSAQLAAGVLTFFICRKFRLIRDGYLAMGHVLVALFLLMCPVLSFFAAHAVFSAFFVTLVTGAVIIALSGSKENVLTQSSYLIKLGGISYALYVVHWPIISFAHINGVVEFSVVLLSIMLVFILLSAILIHVFIEKYFYFNRPSKKLFSVTWLLLWGLTLIALPTYSILYGTGDFERKSREVERLEPELGAVNYSKYFKENYVQRFEYGRFGRCFLSHAKQEHKFNYGECFTVDESRKNIFLMGDSHAAYFSQGIRSVFDDYYLLQSNVVGCLPLLNYSKNDTCDTRNNENFQFLKSNRLDMVIIMARWIKNGADFDRIEATLTELRKYQNNIVLIAGVPQYHKHLARILYDARSLDEAKTIANKMQPYAQKTAALADIDRIATQAGVIFISIPELLCDVENCDIVDAEFRPIFYDYGHMTSEGAEYIAEKLRSRLDNIGLTEVRKP